MLKITMHFYVTVAYILLQGILGTLSKSSLKGKCVIRVRFYVESLSVPRGTESIRVLDSTYSFSLNVNISIFFYVNLIGLKIVVMTISQSKLSPPLDLEKLQSAPLTMRHAV